MKYLLAALALMLVGCTIPGLPPQKKEIDRFAVVEIDRESWIRNYSHGEIAYIGRIDGVDEQEYGAKRQARNEPGGARKEFVFIETGSRELVLNYSRNRMGGLGRKYWNASAYVEVSLEAGRYFVGYETKEEFAILWLEDSDGSLITKKLAAPFESVRSPVPVIIIQK